MDRKTMAIALLVIASLVLGFTLNPWTDEYEADNVGDAESLHDLVTDFDARIDSQTESNKTYTITLTNDITLDSPLVLDFGKNRNDGKNYTINLSLGNFSKSYTLSFVGDFEGSAIQIVNNGQDTIKVNIQRGNIVDERESTEALTTIGATGAGDGAGSTSLKVFTTASISANGTGGSGSSIIGLSGGADLDMQGCLTSSDENTVGVMLDGSSINVSNEKALIDTCSNAIATSGNEASEIEIESGKVIRSTLL